MCTPTQSGLNVTDQVKLAAETAKHYGTIRFSMFTVFTTIAGALLLFPFTSGGSAFLHACGSQCCLYSGLLGSVGLITSVLFALAEYRISRLVVFYQEKAFDATLFPEPPWHKMWSWVVPLIMLSPPLVSVVFWLLFLFGVVDTPILKSNG